MHDTMYNNIIYYADIQYINNMFCYVCNVRRIRDDNNSGDGGLFIKREYICYTQFCISLQWFIT